MAAISSLCKSAFHSQEKSNILLKFSNKTADRLLYEAKPVDRPVGQPPKRKSLEDATEGKGRCVVTPTPSSCSRTDETEH